MNTLVSSDHGKDTVGWPGSNFIRVRCIYDCLVTCFKIYIYIYKINNYWMPTNFRHWSRLKHALSNIFYEWWSYGKDEKIAKFVDSLCDVWWNKSIVHSIILRLKTKQIYSHVTQGQENVKPFG